MLIKTENPNQNDPSVNANALGLVVHGDDRTENKTMKRRHDP